MPKTVKIFLTGAPRSGKTTLLLKVVDQLKAQGLKVGGITTPEFRREGRRIGFKVVDLASGREAVLASSDYVSGPQVGRYRVDLQAFEQVALPALEYAVGGCDLVAVDEIGRMELFSRLFRNMIEEILGCDCPLITVVHQSVAGTYARYGLVVEVTAENRNSLVPSIVNELRKRM